jgi:murein L,D-transpeptidase YafK
VSEDNPIRLFSEDLTILSDSQVPRRFKWIGDKWIFLFLGFSLLFFTVTLFYHYSSLFGVSRASHAVPPFKMTDSLSPIAALPKKPVVVNRVSPNVRDMPLLVVSKHYKRIYILQKKGREWIRIAVFPVIYGEKEGDKTFKGDKKTPEGNYWIIDAFPGVRHGHKYGAIILPLNYPNAEDRREGKSGDGIWIHGSQFGQGLDPTSGCIKLENRDVLSLFRLVEPPVPIIILPKGKSDTSFDKLELDWVRKERPAISESVRQNGALWKDSLSRSDILRLAKDYISREDSLFRGMDSRSGTVLRRLAQWKYAWSKKDLPLFGSLYHNSFLDYYGRNKVDFLNRKERIFQRQDSIRVSLDSITITCSTDSTALASFKQDYRSYTQGRMMYTDTMMKQFDLIKINNSWYIARERVVQRDNRKPSK